MMTLKKLLIQLGIQHRLFLITRNACLLPWLVNLHRKYASYTLVLVIDTGILITHQSYVLLFYFLPLSNIYVSTLFASQTTGFSYNNLGHLPRNQFSVTCGSRPTVFAMKTYRAIQILDLKMFLLNSSNSFTFCKLSFLNVLPNCCRNGIVKISWIKQSGERNQCASIRSY